MLSVPVVAGRVRQLNRMEVEPLRLFSAGASTVMVGDVLITRLDDNCLVWLCALAAMDAVKGIVCAVWQVGPTMATVSRTSAVAPGASDTKAGVNVTQLGSRPLTDRL